jgi:hypothetical protein
MQARHLSLTALPATLFFTAILFGAFTAQAQDSGFELHANSHANAAAIGLPEYPGARPYKDADNDSAADLGLSFGDFHFTVKAVDYETTDSPEQVLAYYRKPLAHYGEVLECNHGKPVGAITVTHTGLTCSTPNGGHRGNDKTGDSSDHELRAGTPHQYRLVGIDSSAHPGHTRFGLVYLELPRDSNGKKSD